MMRAQVLTGLGGPDMLEYRTDWPVPVPEAGEVLVEVSACGVNNTDINTRVGWYGDGGWVSPVSFPRIQGADPVGRIAAVGSGVAPGRIGSRVIIDPWVRHGEGGRYLGSEFDGGFAEFTVVPADNAWAIESPMSDVELATFACSYSTAEHMLERCGTSAGQWVMVSGASGGVGSALIQLAKRRRAHVLALTTPKKVDAIAGIGADVVLDRGSDDLADLVVEATGGVDVFTDVVGGRLFAPLLDAIRRGGHYVVSGAVAGPLVELDLRKVYLRDLTIHGATLVPRQVFENLVGYIRAGELRSVLDRVFPLRELRAAQEYFQRRDHVGSVVIEIGDPNGARGQMSV